MTYKVQKQIQCTNDITAIHTFCIFSVCYVLYGYSVGIIYSKNIFLFIITCKPIISEIINY